MNVIIENQTMKYKFKTQDKIGLFSGRFDGVHTGHLLAIEDLLARYLKIIVVILDYEERSTNVYDVKKIFVHHFNRILPPMMRNRIEIIVNRQHFGFITKTQLAKLPAFDVYLAGNLQVLNHLKTLGYACEYVPRTKIKAEGDEALFPIEATVDMSKIYSGTKVRHHLKAHDKTLSQHYRLNIKS